MDKQSPGLIRFGREICGDLIQAERREWRLANGLDGYAAGTIAGTLTRCYHGLLITPVNPPLGRVLVFAKADATLIDADREVPHFAMCLPTRARQYGVPSSITPQPSVASIAATIPHPVQSRQTIPVKFSGWGVGRKLAVRHEEQVNDV